jgi:DNA-binding GntR family transcriptional regulator
MAATVRSRAARELRERILTGDLPAGTVLDVTAITEEFGTSRTPVREALLELSYEGLVHIAPRSRVIVLGVTPRDVSDSFSLLATLAGKAAGWAAERMTDETLHQLEQLYERTNGAAESTLPALVAANWQFHRAVNLAADSPRLLILVRQAIRVVPRSYFERFPEEEDKARHDHGILLGAFQRRDAAAARAINEEHVAEAGRRIAEWIVQRGRAALDTAS